MVCVSRGIDLKALADAFFGAVLRLVFSACKLKFFIQQFSAYWSTFQADQRNLNTEEGNPLLALTPVCRHTSTDADSSPIGSFYEK